MAQPVTDPALLAQLNSDAPAGPVPVTDPALLAQLNGAAPAEGPGFLGTMKDAAQSLGSGIVRGATETAMLPLTAERLLHSGSDWLFSKIMGHAPAPDASGIRGAVNSGQDAVRSGMDAVLHKPETRTGKFAGTVGEFMAPGGLPSKAVRATPTMARMGSRYASEFAGNVALPAVASEGAGQLAEGSGFETPARLIGALFGNGATALGRAYNAPEAVVRRTVSDVTDDQWQRALELQNNSTGIRLTGPEAIAQATGGGSAAPDVLRVVEGSIEGRSRTAPFFAQRPAQVDTAVGDFLDQIAPQSATPSTLGPQVAAAGQAAIKATPQGQALDEAIWGVGPRTTAEDAGRAIQQPLADIHARREGMRSALGDVEYQAARSADPSIPVSELQPEAVATQRPVYSLEPTPANPETGAPAAMTPRLVEQDLTPPALETQMGPNAIQADPRPVLRFIDENLPNAKAATADALTRVRSNLMGPNGADTSVAGLDNARGEITAMIREARNNGENLTIDMLRQVQQQLDNVLQAVPEYAHARQGFQAASVPLQPFENPSVAKTIARDEYNNGFTTSTELVAPTLEQGGPSAARAFNEVAPNEARVGFENYLATQILDKVTDASGNVAADRLALALRDNEDLLRQYPAVAERLQGVVAADAGLAPVRAGRLGEVARATDTPTAGSAILPQNPLTGSAEETADTVMRLIGQDPGATTGVIRQNLADRYARASTETQGMSREGAGAKFHKDVAGNANKRQTLEAALGALPNGAAAAEAPLILDVLEATGRRKPVGSMTAFNNQIAGDVGEASMGNQIWQLIRSFGTSAVTQATDAAKRAAYRGNIGELADMFTDPQSVELMRNTLNASVPINVRGTATRAAAETLPMLYDTRRR